jgi:osmotically-inducible protein OsmY
MAMQDLTLRENVLEELEYEPGVDAALIGVAVEKGTVTLTGHVMSYPEKLFALDAVRRVKGVRAIADNIEVRQRSALKTPDDQIAKRAADILAWDSVVPKDAISIVVRNGWITLTGKVSWQYQKKAAETHVRKLTGVRGVDNNIQIAAPVNTGDIKQSIENALKRHAEIEAKAIRVSVKDNTVVLEGQVGTLDERSAVENAAWSAAGVQFIDDRLKVGS